MYACMIIESRIVMCTQDINLNKSLNKIGIKTIYNYKSLTIFSKYLQSMISIVNHYQGVITIDCHSIDAFELSQT